MQSLPGFETAVGDGIVFTADMFVQETEESKKEEKKNEGETEETKQKETKKQPKETKKQGSEDAKTGEKTNEEAKKPKKQQKEAKPEAGSEEKKQSKKAPKAESSEASKSVPEEAKKPSKSGPKGGKKPTTEEVGDPASLLDIRVGRIQRIWRHPTREHIFCEEVDMGNGEIRTIASGLVGYVTEEYMSGSLVVILANLKNRKMDDFVSQGMVLCTSFESGIEPLRPPEDSQPGDRIIVEGLPSNPLPELPPKKQYWEAAMKELKVDETGRATYKGQPLVTPLGVVRSPTFKAGTIS